MAEITHKKGDKIAFEYLQPGQFFNFEKELYFKSSNVKDVNVAFLFDLDNIGDNKRIFNLDCIVEPIFGDED